MEKKVTCTKCKRAFVVKGKTGGSKEVAQKATCLYCKEPNDVMWPMNDGYSVEPAV
jgi:hypothetical protein